MKIGFDLDGVLCDCSGTILNFERVFEKMNVDNIDKIDQYYYKERKPLLNPKLFMGEQDIGFCITSRPRKFRDVTNRWMNKYYSDIPVYLLKNEIKAKDCVSFDDIMRRVAIEKIKLIEELKLDVYIDDTPNIIYWMRKLNTGVKFIQYGGLL